jgi:hypothetical protein
MYETLSGTPPLLGDSFLQTMNMHVSQQPKPIKDVAPDSKVPPQLEQLILHCMSKEPSARFQTAGEVRDAISAMTYELLGNTGKQRGFISGAVPPAVIAKKSKAWAGLAFILGGLIVGGISFVSLYPGPNGDRGTPLAKMQWQFAWSSVDSAITNGDYASAEASAKKAEQLARTFGDNKTRLESTLKSLARIYEKWDGHAEQLERINNEITQIQTDRLQDEFAERMRLLHGFEKPVQSGVSETNRTLNAEAQIPGLLSTSDKLYGRGMYKEADELLEKTVAIETKLLGPDSTSLAQLLARLADCHIQLHKFTEVRPLLVHAMKLRQKQCEQNPSEYVRSLNKLGQFDLDQNDMKQAEGELRPALDEARKLKGNKDLLLVCIRSYADLLRQTHRENESKQLVHEADALDLVKSR